MNEQDELALDVQQAMYNYVAENNADGTVEGYIRITSNFANDIIALVRADMARKLLSDGRDVIAKWLPPRTDKHDPMWDMIDIEDMARDIATAIGLDVEEDV